MSLYPIMTFIYINASGHDATLSTLENSWRRGGKNKTEKYCQLYWIYMTKHNPCHEIYSTDFFFFSNKSCRWKRFNESDYISTRFHIFDVINGNIHVFMWHFIIVHSYINHQSVQFVCIEKHQLRNYEITRRFWGGKYEWNCCNRFMLQMVTDGKLFLFHAEW